jgi:hypothetical protein
LENGEDEKMMGHGVFLKRIGNTYGRKLDILFGYNTYFKCCFGISFNKHKITL